MSKAKISAFFKPSPPQSNCSSLLSDPISPSISRPLDGINGELEKRDESSNSTKVVNKKRSYAQYHLELGQRDFMLQRCSVCGMMYARGDEADEKVHKAYHKEYYEGIAFKGWKNERVVARFCNNTDRIIMVQDDDSSVQKQKVRQVIKTVEKELGFGEGQLLHGLCKVYMYISSHKIVGCLVAEPIKKAHRVISNNTPLKTVPNSTANNKIMNFGKFSFKREVFRKCTSSEKKSKEENLGSSAIICEEEGVSAILGFRAIWVAPSERRKGTGSHLLDAARKSFCENENLEISQCAFSPPTSSGKELARNYCKTVSFLIYKTDQ